MKQGFQNFKYYTENFCLYAILYRGSITYKLTKMESKKLSLMERRKQKLGGLQNTIKNLSCVENQLKVPAENGTHQTHPYSQKVIKVRSNGQEVTSPLVVLQKESGGSLMSSEDQDMTHAHMNKFEEKYEVLQKIGEGAHGVVSKCISKKTKKLFAVKTLRWEDQHFRSLKTNFINIKKLKQRSILKYKALFLNDKIRVCHTVTQYFPHPPLKPQNMDEDELRTVFYQIFEALSYLHKNSICHRDIKPDNILYDRDERKIKIIDFGVSKNVKTRGRKQNMLTDTGTFYYKAPEMFMGGGYTEAVDSWAIGICLYEMIVGITPFASEYLLDTKEKIMNSEPDFSRLNFFNFNPLVKDLISHLLKKNPKERISCEEAKKHLWFFSHLSSNQIMKSAEFQIKSMQSKDKDELTTWVLKRKDSLKESKNTPGQAPVTKAEKKLMKTWLETINEDAHSFMTSDVAIDFVESEEEDDFTFMIPEELPLKPSKSTQEPMRKDSKNRTFSHI